MPTARTRAFLLNETFQSGCLHSEPSLIAGLQDLIVSLTPNYGGLYISTAAATTIGVAGTMVKAAGTTTATNLRGITMPADNRLTYVGNVDPVTGVVPDNHMHIALSFSMTMAGINDNITVGIALNGVVDDASVLTRFVGTGSDRGAAASHTDIMMSENDYLEVFVTNEDATAAVTLEQMYLFALGMAVTG